jgi:hypothetical protein
MKTRNSLTQRHLRRCGFCIAIIGLAGIAFAVSILHPSGEWQVFFPKCMFFRTTGFHCPGCGCTRAVHYLLNGKILLAMQYNAMLVVALPWLTCEAVRASFWFLELPLPGFMERRIRLYGWPTILIAVAIMAFWILRNVPCSPFDWLAPPLLE